MVGRKDPISFHTSCRTFWSYPISCKMFTIFEICILWKLCSQSISCRRKRYYNAFCKTPQESFKRHKTNFRDLAQKEINHKIFPSIVIILYYFYIVDIIQCILRFLSQIFTICYVLMAKQKVKGLWYSACFLFEPSSSVSDVYFLISFHQFQPIAKYSVTKQHTDIQSYRKDILKQIMN